MRKLMIIAAPLALMACAEQATDVEEEVVETEPAGMTTANGTAPGTYAVSNDEGPAGTSVLNGDGTYQDLAADGSVADEGTWEVVDGKTCFTSNEDGAEALCWTESEPAEDGSFTATSDAGETVTVSPAVVEAEGEAEE
ncbi:MAG: hypothetical protein R3235_07445 [Altererythrobacter ishigakiensis]|nr:hypothetical protein [Altererythrobacter ishigakiensis]